MWPRMSVMARIIRVAFLGVIALVARMRLTLPADVRPPGSHIQPTADYSLGEESVDLLGLADQPSLLEADLLEGARCVRGQAAKLGKDLASLVNGAGEAHNARTELQSLR
jgi:hypothetical protein